MNFETIETERLILRKIATGEYKYVFDNYSPEQIKAFFGHNTEEEYQQEKFKHEGGFSTYRMTFLAFLLIDKATQDVIGRCGFHNWYGEYKRAELGYAMAREDYKEKGLMSEAVK